RRSHATARTRAADPLPRARERDGMKGTDWALVAAVVVLFFVSGALALAETAFTKVSRIRALALEEEGAKHASRLVRMLEDPARTLNSVLLILLVCQFTAATLVGVLVEKAG